MFRQNREFQAGLDPKEARRRREKNSLSLRRKDREAKLQNKRKKILHKIQIESQAQIPVTKANEQQQIRQLLYELPRYVEGIFTEHKAAIYECLKKIRYLLSFSCNAVPVKEVVDSGVISRIIKFLHRKDDPKIMFESMWVLTNIASSESEYTDTIVRDGALPALYQVLQIPKYPLQEQAIWAIGNIAGDCMVLRDKVLNSNILSLLLHISKAPFTQQSFCKEIQMEGQQCTAQLQYISLLSNLSWAISNLCRGGHHDVEHLSKLIKCAYYIFKNKRKLPNTINKLDIDDSIAWTFCYLTQNENVETDSALVNEMYRIGITGELIKLLSTQHFRPCLKVIGNILAGHNVYTQQCIDLGVLQIMNGLLKRLNNSANGELLKELCWCISNICAGSVEHVVLVQKQGIFPIITQLIEGRTLLVAKEALWVVANAMSNGNKGVIAHLVNECGLIEAVCNFNKRAFANGYRHNMETTVMVSLDCIESVLGVNSRKFADQFEMNHGLDFLEYLQSDQTVPQDVYNRAVGIIQEWFGGDMDEDFGENNEIKNNVDISYHGDNVYGNQFGFGTDRNEKNNDKQSTNRFQF